MNLRGAIYLVVTTLHFFGNCWELVVSDVCMSTAYGVSRVPFAPSDFTGPLSGMRLAYRSGHTSCNDDLELETPWACVLLNSTLNYGVQLYSLTELYGLWEVRLLTDFSSADPLYAPVVSYNETEFEIVSSPPTLLDPVEDSDWFSLAMTLLEPFGGTLCVDVYFRNAWTFVSEALPWAEASNYCRANGQELVSLHSEAERKAMENAIPWYGRDISTDGFWLGAVADKGDFRWIDGSGVMNNSWLSPRNVSRGERCLQWSNIATGELQSDKCCTRKPFICQDVSLNRTERLAIEANSTQTACRMTNGDIDCNILENATAEVRLEFMSTVRALLVIDACYLSMEISFRNSVNTRRNASTPLNVTAIGRCNYIDEYVVLFEPPIAADSIYLYATHGGGLEDSARIQFRVYGVARLDAEALASSTPELCSSNADCGDGKYCASDGDCYTNSECCEYDDAIDECPEECLGGGEMSESAEERRLPAPGVPSSIIVSIVAASLTFTLCCGCGAYTRAQYRKRVRRLVPKPRDRLAPKPRDHIELSLQDNSAVRSRDHELSQTDSFGLLHKKLPPSRESSASSSSSSAADPPRLNSDPPRMNPEEFFDGDDDGSVLNATNSVTALGVDSNSTENSTTTRSPKFRKSSLDGIPKPDPGQKVALESRILPDLAVNPDDVSDGEGWTWMNPDDADFDPSDAYLSDESQQAELGFSAEGRYSPRDTEDELDSGETDRGTLSTKVLLGERSRGRPKTVFRGEDDSTCPHCKKTFTAVCNLLTHIREQHGKVKGYKCAQCGKAFMRKYNLQVHERTHAKGVRNVHSCKLCKESFAQRTNLKRHMKVRHEYPAKCSKCTKRFASTAGFDEHAKQAHKDAEGVCLHVRAVSLKCVCGEKSADFPSLCEHQDKCGVHMSIAVPEIELFRREREQNTRGRKKTLRKNSPVERRGRKTKLPRDSLTERVPALADAEAPPPSKQSSKHTKNDAFESRDVFRDAVPPEEKERQEQSKLTNRQGTRGDASRIDYRSSMNLEPVAVSLPPLRSSPKSVLESKPGIREGEQLIVPRDAKGIPPETHRDEQSMSPRTYIDATPPTQLRVKQDATISEPGGNRGNYEALPSFSNVRSDHINARIPPFVAYASSIRSEQNNMSSCAHDLNAEYVNTITTLPPLGDHDTREFLRRTTFRAVSPSDMTSSVPVAPSMTSSIRSEQNNMSSCVHDLNAECVNTITTLPPLGDHDSREFLRRFSAVSPTADMTSSVPVAPSMTSSMREGASFLATGASATSSVLEINKSDASVSEESSEEPEPSPEMIPSDLDALSISPFAYDTLSMPEVSNHDESARFTESPVPSESSDCSYTNEDDYVDPRSNGDSPKGIASLRSSDFNNDSVLLLEHSNSVRLHSRISTHDEPSRRELSTVSHSRHASMSMSRSRSFNVDVGSEQELNPVSDAVDSMVLDEHALSRNSEAEDVPSQLWFEDSPGICSPMSSS